MVKKLLFNDLSEAWGSGVSAARTVGNAVSTESAAVGGLALVRSAGAGPPIAPCSLGGRSWGSRCRSSKLDGFRRCLNRPYQQYDSFISMKHIK